MGHKLKFDIEPDELDIFIEEVNEHLQVIENGVLRLEKISDPGTINAIFRGAHTIKALAGTVGHHQMAELTHTIENLFDLMRESKLTASQPVVDQLLGAVDILKILRDEFVNQETNDLDINEVLISLKELTIEDSRQVQNSPIEAKTSSENSNVSKKKIDLSLTSEQLAHAKRLHERNFNILMVNLELDQNTFAASARLLQVAKSLLEQGECILQEPTTADIAENLHSGRLKLLLATKMEPAKIATSLSQIAELTSHNVQLYPIDSSQENGSTRKIAPLSKQEITVTENTVRISVERLDTLMNLVGELVTNRNRLVQVESVIRTQFGKAEIVEELGESSAHIGRIIDQLQGEVMRTRMLPISHVFDKFPRIIRDVARSSGRQVNLVVEGATTELDRSLIEAIKDPLIHLLRNAVDHGISSPEDRIKSGKPPTGTVTLTAAHTEGHIVITVGDDGRGIDPNHVRQAAIKRGLISEERAAQLNDEEAIDIIFQPNLSTAETLTEVSGRGVGMDVVRTNVEKLGGTVFVESRLGRGTVFRVTLPLTLAIMETMLVRIRNTVYAVPLSSINDVLYLSEVKVSTVNRYPSIQWRGALLPLLNLREFFGDVSTSNRKVGDDKSAIVSVAWGKQRVGLIIDQIIGKQGIVVKSLGSLIGDIAGLSGCTILGDGNVALIVDVPSLIGATLKMRRQVIGNGA